jgi:hypothetical protein
MRMPDAHRVPVGLVVSAHVTVGVAEAEKLAGPVICAIPGEFAMFGAKWFWTLTLKAA